MNRRWLAIAMAVTFVACNKTTDSTKPAASAASSAENQPSSTAVAAQPASVQGQGEVAYPMLPSAEEAENTSDITASSYRKDLDGLEKEIAGLK